MTPGITLSERLMSTKIGDFCIIIYVVLAVAFDDGSLPVQLARIFLAFGAITDLATKSFRFNAVQVWQALFILHIWLSTMWAMDIDNAKGVALTTLINGACLVALVFLVQDDSKRINLFLVCMMVSPLLLMLRVGISNGFFVFFDTRVVGETSANTIGMTAALAFCLSFVSFTQRALTPRWISSTFLALNLAITILSASRKALVILVLVVVIYSILLPGAHAASRIFRAVLVSVSALIGYGLIMYVDPLYRLVGHRIETMINGLIGTGEVDDSTQTRMGLIEYGVGWFREKPWLGYGGDNFRALMEVYYPGRPTEYSHNNFIELLVNFGVIGLVLFYWIYYTIIRTGFKKHQALQPIQTMILSLVISLLVIEYGFVDYYSRVFMAFVAVAWVAICTDTLNRTGQKIETGRSPTHAF